MNFFWPFVYTIAEIHTVSSNFSAGRGHCWLGNRKALTPPATTMVVSYVFLSLRLLPRLADQHIVPLDHGWTAR